MYPTSSSILASPDSNVDDAEPFVTSIETSIPNAPSQTSALQSTAFAHYSGRDVDMDALDAILDDEGFDVAVCNAYDDIGMHHDTLLPAGTGHPATDTTTDVNADNPLLGCSNHAHVHSASITEGLVAMVSSTRSATSADAGAHFAVPTAVHSFPGMAFHQSWLQQQQEVCSRTSSGQPQQQLQFACPPEQDTGLTQSLHGSQLQSQARLGCSTGNSLVEQVAVTPGSASYSSHLQSPVDVDASSEGVPDIDEVQQQEEVYNTISLSAHIAGDVLASEQHCCVNVSTAEAAGVSGGTHLQQQYSAEQQTIMGQPDGSWQPLQPTNTSTEEQPPSTRALQVGTVQVSTAQLHCPPQDDEADTSNEDAALYASLHSSWHTAQGSSSYASAHSAMTSTSSMYSSMASSAAACLMKPSGIAARQQAMHEHTMHGLPTISSHGQHEGATTTPQQALHDSTDATCLHVVAPAVQSQQVQPMDSYMPGCMEPPLTSASHVNVENGEHKAVNLHAQPALGDQTLQQDHPAGLKSMLLAKNEPFQPNASAQRAPVPSDACTGAPADMIGPHSSAAPSSSTVQADIQSPTVNSSHIPPPPANKEASCAADCSTSGWHSHDVMSQPQQPTHAAGAGYGGYSILVKPAGSDIFHHQPQASSAGSSMMTSTAVTTGQQPQLQATPQYTASTPCQLPTAPPLLSAQLPPVYPPALPPRPVGPITGTATSHTYTPTTTTLMSGTTPQHTYPMHRYPPMSHSAGMLRESELVDLSLSQSIRPAAVTASTFMPAVPLPPAAAKAVQRAGHALDAYVNADDSSAACQHPPHRQHQLHWNWQLLQPQRLLTKQVPSLAAGHMQPSSSSGSYSNSTTAAGRGNTQAAAAAVPALAGDEGVWVEHCDDMPQTVEQQMDEQFRGLTYTDGQDSHGRPVIVVNTDAIPTGLGQGARDAVLAYLIQRLTPIVSQVCSA